MLLLDGTFIRKKLLTLLRFSVSFSPYQWPQSLVTYRVTITPPVPDQATRIWMEVMRNSGWTLATCLGMAPAVHGVGAPVQSTFVAGMTVKLLR